MNALLFTANMSTNMVITSIFIGLMLALTAMFCYKYSLGKFVDKLVKEGVDSPEKARTLKELSANFLVRAYLSEGSSVRRMFGYTLEDQVFDDPNAPLPKKEGRKDLSEARFYLLPEKKAEATTRFPLKGNSPLTFLLCVALMVVAYYLLKDILPALFETLVQSYSSTGA